MPTYPEEAKKSHAEGLAVVELEFDMSGNVTFAEIVESPHQTIGEAVAEATKQWKFKPFTMAGTPVYVRGRLRFYFELDGDKARVKNP